MTQQAFERGDWAAVIAAHPLESHEAEEWLRYGAALLHTIEPRPEQGRQQQQAALAFVQAQKEGASAEQVAEAQRRVVMLSLEQALGLVGVATSVKGQESSSERSVLAADQPGFPASAPEAGGETLSTMAAGHSHAQPKDPLRGLVSALASGFGLQLPAEASLLDQLLVAKQQLNQQKVRGAAVEDLLRHEIPIAEQAWADALQKVLLVLRLPEA